MTHVGRFHRYAGMCMIRPVWELGTKFLLGQNNVILPQIGYLEHVAAVMRDFHKQFRIVYVH